MTNEELSAMGEKIGTLKLYIFLGFITIPIIIGVPIIIYAYYRLYQIGKAQRILSSRVNELKSTSGTETKLQCRSCNNWNIAGSNNCTECGNPLQTISDDDMSNLSQMSDRQLADLFPGLYKKGVILSLLGFFGSMIVVGIPVLIYGLIIYARAMKVRKEIMNRHKIGKYDPFGVSASENGVI